MPVVGPEPKLIPQGGSIQVIAGDSYQAAETRAYEFEETSEWPPISGAAAFVVFKAKNRYGTSSIEPPVTGSITKTSKPQKCLVELTHAQTEPLKSGGYIYDVVATLQNGHVASLSRGTMVVVQQASE